MLHFPYEIRDSLIPGAGKGLFAVDAIPRGRVISSPTHIEETFPLREFLDDPEHPHAYSAVRWFEDHCTIAPEWPDECHLNHSFDPNGLWHIGFVFARRDINPGEEITIDYRHILGPGVEEPFLDAMTGRPIIGLDWASSARETAAELIGLLSAD